MRAKKSTAGFEECADLISDQKYSYALQSFNYVGIRKLADIFSHNCIDNLAIFALYIQRFFQTATDTLHYNLFNLVFLGNSHIRRAQRGNHSDS